MSLISGFFISGFSLYLICFFPYVLYAYMFLFLFLFMSPPSPALCGLGEPSGFDPSQMKASEGGIGPEFPRFQAFSFLFYLQILHSRHFSNYLGTSLISLV